LLCDEKMNELVKNLRKAREEAEDFSREMLSEYEKHIQTRFPDDVYEMGISIDWPPFFMRTRRLFGCVARNS